MSYNYNRRNSTTSSIFEAFTLNPMPYPVHLIFGVIATFLGIWWYFSYESVVEAAEEKLNWGLFVTPIVLVLIVQWLSSFENEDMFFGMWPTNQRRPTYHQPAEGSSPWGVAAVIVLLLVLLKYQSKFLESWF